MEQTEPVLCWRQRFTTLSVASSEVVNEVQNRDKAALKVCSARRKLEIFDFEGAPRSPLAPESKAC